MSFDKIGRFSFDKIVRLLFDNEITPAGLTKSIADGTDRLDETDVLSAEIRSEA